MGRGEGGSGGRDGEGGWVREGGTKCCREWS